MGRVTVELFISRAATLPLYNLWFALAISATGFDKIEELTTIDLFLTFSKKESVVADPEISTNSVSPIFIILW